MFSIDASGRYRTPRDLYYNDVNLFSNQDTVARTLADWACYLRVPRTSLRCVSTAPTSNNANILYKLGSRGMIAGCIELSLAELGEGSKRVRTANIHHLPAADQLCGHAIWISYP